MSDWQCPYCPTVLKSEKTYNSHLAINHEAMLEGEIREESIKSLIKTKEQVKFLLIKFPAARSSDKLLYQKLLQYFHNNIIIYDSADQLIKPANGIGWSFEIWLAMPSYETCRRSRQHLQEKALKAIEAGIGTELDAMLLPSDRVALQRELKEKAYRQFFAVHGSKS